jgi:hypothetical protein
MTTSFFDQITYRLTTLNFRNPKHYDFAMQHGCRGGPQGWLSADGAAGWAAWPLDSSAVQGRPRGASALIRNPRIVKPPPGQY